MADTDTKALVLFSGGQDSTVVLAWALTRFAHVETIGFTYGQRHDVEMDCRRRVIKEIRAVFTEWSEHLGTDHVLDLPALAQISDTALTREVEIEIADTGLPTTFVPGRNLLFFTYAAALGYRRGIQTLVGGMCETDFSGYPDCRDATLKSLGESIRLGTEVPFQIETPLMHLTKADTWAMAEDIGGPAFTDIVTEHTHSCYVGERSQRHPWGYGCGSCPACTLRAAGFDAWKASTTG